VSRPPQARARTDGSVRQSAQRSADRSVQPRSQGRCAAGLPPPCAGLPGDVLPPVGAATRSNSRCALPHLAAPQGAHEGRHRRRGALPVPWMPLAPSPPHGGFANRCAPERRLRRPRRGRRPPPCTALFGLHLTLCGLAFLRAWFRNVMPEVSGVKARPRGAYQQDGPHGLAASEGVSGGPRCWRAAGARSCPARHGRGLAGSVEATCPHTPRRSLRSVVGRMVFHWRRAVCRRSGRCGRLPMAGEASWVDAARGPLPWPAAGRCGSSCWKATQGTLRSLLRQGQAPSAPPALQSCCAPLRSLDTRSLRVGFAASAGRTKTAATSRVSARGA